jgi:serine/threonine protein kinase
MIGPYRLTKTLGQGAFGKVKCKFHKNTFAQPCIVGINDVTKEKVAIKMISKDLLEVEDGKLKKKLESEVSIM